MERKLVKQGRNALTVTLPSKWLKDKGLKPGSSVFVEAGKDIVITSSSAAAKTAIELDVRGQDRPMIFHSVNAVYIEGHDVISIRHDCSKWVSEVAQSLIGMVTEEQTSSKVVLKSIIVVPEDNFNALLRRAAHMLTQQARIVVDLSRGKATFEDVKDQEKLLDKNILYCLRYLSKYEHNKSHRQFMVCSTIELAADQISRIARAIGKNRTLADLVLHHVEEYTRLLFTHDLKKMYASLRVFRNSIGTKTFVDGMAYSLAEILYNYIGYVVGEKEFKQIPLPD